MGGTFAAAGLVVLALLVVPAFAAPMSAPSGALVVGPSEQWAYGAEKWVNVTVNLPNGTYTEKAFFGWQVIFTATNTSNSTQAWEVQRTVGGSFYAQYCHPNCSAPTAFGNLSIVGLERDAGFANLTTTATVYVNGTAVAAVGLLNASFENSAYLNESMRYGLSGGSFSGNASAGFDLSGSAHGAVSFSPALGLVPMNVSAPEAWNSSSAFSSAGAWAVAFSASRTSFGGVPTSDASTASGNVDLTGTVALWGSDLGKITLANGVTVPVIALAWTGPFDVVDGVILIPHDFDLFGGDNHSWGGDELGTEDIATSNLDIRMDAAHHLEVVAAATSYAAADNSLVGPSPPSSNGATPLATTSSPTVVQAQPETVPQAQHGASCLAGACAATVGTVGAMTAGLALGAVVLAVAAVALVGLALARRGRRAGAAQCVAPPAGAVDPPTGNGAAGNP
ncbi:MAG: hypothetical protein L3K17_05405 [Thermoplasmata archaeon]|nr:hypothetical protein [Thermoplasmata archaeon]